MASSGAYVQVAVVLLAVQLVCVGAAEADQETGTVIPAESRCNSKMKSEILKGVEICLRL